MRAFFSYSHADSELVHSVVGHVGRPFVTIDEAAFAPGDDILGSVEGAVPEAAVFVLFASRSSMASRWVTFEVNEARYSRILGALKKVIVVLLDDRLKPSDFPTWMQRYRFVSSRAARPIARVVRSAVDELIQEGQHRYFVGRAVETADLQAALAPPDGAAPANVVVLTGLPGVGRRTLLRRVVRDSLSVERLTQIDVESGDSLQDFATKIADVSGSVMSHRAALDANRVVQQQSDEGTAIDITKDASDLFHNYHELLVLYDAGGLLDPDGHPTPAIASLLRAFQDRLDLYAVLVSNRRPSRVLQSILHNVPQVHVAPLTLPEVKQLLALLALAHEIVLSPAMSSALGEQVHGYPPSAIVAVRLMREYGGDLAARQSRQLDTFTARPLQQYLRSVSLSAVQREVLRTLAGNSPLPFGAT